MNDRIRELMRQATEYKSNGDDTESPVLNPEKFAELIVAECVDLCLKQVVGSVGTYPSAHNNAVGKCIDAIKEQFGKHQCI